MAMSAVSVFNCFRMVDPIALLKLYIIIVILNPMKSHQIPLNPIKSCIQHSPKYLCQTYVSFPSPRPPRPIAMTS